MSNPIITTVKEGIKNVFVPRKVFPDYRVNLADFKGHQNKALKKMQQLSPQINLILELRDSRSPLSTANLLLDKLFRNKDKIILYTKKDMSPIGSQLLNKWHNPLNEKWQFMDCRNKNDTVRLLKSLRDKFKSMYPPPPLGLRMMIVGMPNVGKSTIVNSLRKFGLNLSNNKNVARIGNQAGITRNTSEIIRISSEPEILLYDTPGVLLPQVNNIETMLSLYLIGTVSQSSIDPVIACDYLLYVMNLKDNTGKAYKRYLKRPTNDVYELLDAVAKKTGNRNKVDGNWKSNYVGCAFEFIRKYQMGELGKWCLDVEVINKESSEEFKDKMNIERDRLSNMNIKMNEKVDKATLEKKKPTRQERLIKQSNQLFLINDR